MRHYLSADHEPEVRRFVADHVRNVDEFSPSCPAIGWLRDISETRSEIVGGVVLYKKSEWDAELSIALLPSCRITRGDIGTLFSVAFEGFGLKRLTCHIARRNTRARRFVEHIGFRQEGALRRGYDGTQTAIVYGMTVDECPWLKG